MSRPDRIRVDARRAPDRKIFRTPERSTPATDHPDVALLEWDAELEARVIEWADLDEAWPKGKPAMARHEIGCRHRACLARIRAIQASIVATKARTGAAVQLGRPEVLLDREGRATAIRLLASVLGALEARPEAA